MRYRVHYTDRKKNDGRLIMEIEAASPQGAIVKFRHVHNGDRTSTDKQAEIEDIVSVSELEESKAREIIEEAKIILVQDEKDELKAQKEEAKAAEAEAEAEAEVEVEIEAEIEEASEQEPEEEL